MQQQAVPPVAVEQPPMSAAPPAGPLYLEQPTSPLSIASLIFGITGFTVLPFIGSIVAVVLGHMARAEIKRSQGGYGGNNLAMIGLVLGYIGVGLIVLVLVLIVLALLLGVFAFVHR